MLLIYNAHLVDKNVDIKKGALLLCGNKIEGFVAHSVVARLLKDKDVSSYDAKGHLVMPAFVDMHAHFRDPGLTYKEDIESGCKAAAAGGFGTLVLMPNTKPVVSSMAAAKANDDHAAALGFAQVIQSTSITKDFDGASISHIDTLDTKIVPLITEDGHEVTDSAVMLEAMKKAAKKKIIVSCHCEDPFLAAAARQKRSEALALLKSKSASAKKQSAALLREADTLLAAAENAGTVKASVTIAGKTFTKTSGGQDCAIAIRVTN